jgi:hypothetical protein
MAIPPQAPDSSEPGFLQSQPPRQPNQVIPGQPLINFLQQWIAGVSYIEETLVRPRWQPQPPNIPAFGTDWVAIGIAEFRPIGIYPSGARLWYAQPGIQQLQRFEEFELLCSWYGPHCEEFAGNLHDGSQVWQNYWVLNRAGIKLVEVHALRHVPELIREQYTDRIDMEITFRRVVIRDYPILSIRGVHGLVRPNPGEPYVAPFSVLPEQETDNGSQ